MLAATKETKLDKPQVLKNGMKLEGYGEGGLVEFVSTNKINFFRDVHPMFQSTYVFIFMHLFNYFTGNLAIPLFLAFAGVVKCYLFDNTIRADKQNISKVSEREFYNDYRFNYPMWSCVILGTMTWMW